MIQFKCDNCRKETYVNPPTDVVLGGVNEYETQDFNTGAMRKVSAPEVIDLKPRAYIIKLNAGQQVIQKDFCKECLEKVMPEVQALWDKLKTFVGD